MTSMRIEPWLEQVFYLSGTKPNSAGIILSCGIHGDETGPIDLIHTLLDDIRNGLYKPAAPTLVIFANPAAIEHQRRYMEFNLNRLFGPTDYNGPEAIRAQNLMQACRKFHNLTGAISSHLDLHSTIKPSRFPRFALQPVGQSTLPLTWEKQLTNGGFTALVQQTSAAHTFSQFTSDAFDCISFTLECGTHDDTQKPDNNTLIDLQSWIKAILCNEVNDQGNDSDCKTPTLQHFEVTDDITRSSAQFRFLIDTTAPNFTLIPADTPIYEEGGDVVRLKSDRFTLFLNSQVEPGQRAGLLLKSI